MCLVWVIFLACGKQKPADKGIMQGMQPGPPLQHVQTVQVKTDTIPLPGKTAPAKSAVELMVTDGSAMFQGEMAGMKGRLEQNEETFRFFPVTGKPLNIEFHVPQGLNIAKIGSVEALLQIKYQWGPEGGDQFVSLSTARELLLGYVWQSSEKPLSVSFGQGFTITQVALSDSVRNKTGYTTVACFLNGPGGRQALVEGKPIEIVKNNKTYVCLPEISVYFKPNDPGEDGKEGYILKASIFQKNQ